MAPVWSLGRTKYHKIGHRGQNNDKCQYHCPICLNLLSSTSFVIQITKSVIHRSTPIYFQNMVVRVNRARLCQPLPHGFGRQNVNSKSLATVHIQSGTPGFEFDFWPSGNYLELSDEKNRTSK